MRFIGCLTELTGTPFQINYVDTKNQPVDMLTKGCFTRDQWNHLLRLLSVVNFSMLSCNRVFLNMKWSPMSKRSQEDTFKGGSAMTKPRPLIWRNLLSTRKDSPQDMSHSKCPVNAEVEHGCVSAGVRKLTRDTSQNPAMYSHVKQQDDTQYASTWKQERRCDFSDSAALGTQVQGVDTQIDKSRMKFRNKSQTIHTGKKLQESQK